VSTASLPVTGAAVEPAATRAWWAMKNTWVLARRSIARIAREPEQLIDVTIQPVMFVLLFTYVFGSAIHLPGGGSYHQYLISGMFGPIARSAVLAGRAVSDLATQLLGIVVLAACGLAVGWRIHNGIGDALLALGLSLLFAFAMTWAGACAGMLLRSPESAQAMGFVLFLPLSFVSNAFVPTQGMPAWLRDFANWNPLSAVAAMCRNLFGGSVPSSAVPAWPMQHPELAVLAWSVALIAVFAPTAVYLYRRKVLR
jgi:ABC-2 type transport system permease protein